MKTITIPRRVGGSLVVTLPNFLVKAESLEEDVPVEIEVKKSKKSFFGALKGVGPFTKEDRMEDREI